MCVALYGYGQEMKKREKANLRIVNQLVPGTKVRAIYADEENDPSWYDAVIDSVEVSIASKGLWAVVLFEI